MQLTPTLKFVLIAAAVAVNLLAAVWVGIKIDALALGLNEHLYNIGAVVIASLHATVDALLVYLGIKAPTLEEEENGSVRSPSLGG